MASPAAPAQEVTWTLDPAHTLVEFTAKHMMITNVRGHFTGVTGMLRINRDRPERSSVSVTIAAASLTTGVDDRDNHLRSADFLNVETYPEIRFSSAAVQGTFVSPGDRFSVQGDLTIGATARPVTLSVEFEGEGKDPWGGTRISFSADTTIDRREFGLTWNQALEAGGMLVGNDIAIHLEAQAVAPA